MVRSPPATCRVIFQLPLGMKLLPFFQQGSQVGKPHLQMCATVFGSPKRHLPKIITVVCLWGGGNLWILGGPKWKWCVNILWVLWFFETPWGFVSYRLATLCRPPPQRRCPDSRKMIFTYFTLHFTEALQTHTFHQWREPLLLLLLLLTPLIIVDSNGSSDQWEACVWLELGHPSFFYIAAHFFVELETYKSRRKDHDIILSIVTFREAPSPKKSHQDLLRLYHWNINCHVEKKPFISSKSPSIIKTFEIPNPHI